MWLFCLSIRWYSIGIVTCQSTYNQCSAPLLIRRPNSSVFSFFPHRPAPPNFLIRIMSDDRYIRLFCFDVLSLFRVLFWIPPLLRFSRLTITLCFSNRFFICSPTDSLGGFDGVFSTTVPRVFFSESFNRWVLIMVLPACSLFLRLCSLISPPSNLSLYKVPWPFILFRLVLPGRFFKFFSLMAFVTSVLFFPHPPRFFFFFFFGILRPELVGQSFHSSRLSSIFTDGLYALSFYCSGVCPRRCPDWLVFVFLVLIGGPKRLV